MNTLKQKVYETGMKEIRNANFSGTLEVEEKYMNKSSYEANTGMQIKDIHFGYDPRIVEKKGENSLLEVSSDSTAHEINHHKYGKNCIGCPQNVDKDHDLFFLPMFEILNKEGFNENDVDYATNALEDSILHRDLKKNEKRKLNGIVTFFEDVGEHIKKFTDFYEAHVKLNMDLWGEKKQKRRLSKFYKNSDKVKEVLIGFYKELNNGALIKENKRIYRLRKDFKKTDNLDREVLRNYVLEENNWKEISEIYAKHFSKLMTPNYALPTHNHNGAGTRGRESEDSSKQGNPFKVERNSRLFKKSRVMKAHKNGEKAPEWIDKMEAMKVLYESLAEQLEIKAESFVNPETFPISWYGERPFNPERDNLKNIKFGINEQGEIELKKKQYSINTQINVKTSPKSFPKIKFGIFDISSSMENDLNGGNKIGNTSIIPWGDNSKYHWQVLTQMEIFEYFKRNHLLTQNSISVATFGKETQVIEGYENVLNHLLTPNFENYTQIDFKKLEKFFEGEGNLIYSGGDGEIGNWSSIKDKFINLAKKHSYVHFHMGKENSMTKDLKKAGLEVIVAEDGKGIVNKVVDLTDKFVRG